MDVPGRVASKIDRDLEAKLLSAEPDESVRIVARLSPAASSGRAETSHPSEFRSREDWRKDLIRRQRAAVQLNIGSLLESLRRLGVTIVAGGEVSAEGGGGGAPPASDTGGLLCGA